MDQEKNRRSPSMDPTRYPSESMARSEAAIDDAITRIHQKRLNTNLPEEYDQMISTALQKDTEEFPIYIRIENLNLPERVKHDPKRPLYSLKNLNKFFSRLDSI